MSKNGTQALLDPLRRQVGLRLSPRHRLNLGFLVGQENLAHCSLLVALCQFVDYLGHGATREATKVSHRSCDSRASIDTDS